MTRAGRLADYLAESRRLLFTSLRPGRRLISQMLLDTAQLAAMLALLMLTAVLLATMYAPLTGVGARVQGIQEQMAETGELPAMDDELAAALAGDVSDIKRFITIMFAVAGAGLLIAVIISGIFRSLVYRMFEGSGGHMRRFIIGNAAWLLLSGAVVFATVLLLKPGIAVFAVWAELLLFFHLSCVLRLRMSQGAGTRQLARGAYDGMKRFHLFVLPLLLMMLAFALVMQLVWLVGLVPDGPLMLALGFSLLLWASWARGYHVAVQEAGR